VTRLLSIRLSALGDIIHTVPAVMSLRDAFDVSWVVEAAYAELVQIVTGVNVIPVRLKRGSLRDIDAARRSVRGFDVAVDFQGLIKSALLTRVAAPQRYGFAREAVREKPASFFYNHKIGIDRARHVVDWNMQLAQALPRRNPAANPPQPNWSAYPGDPQNRLSAFKDKIVLLPGAGRAEKQWPVERFSEVVRRYGNDALVVWGPSERDLAEKTGGLIAPETNLRELAFILQNARVVAGGDTGPLHLADALGTKVVGLYGPTNPSRNGPYGQLQRTIRGAAMDAISGEEVMRKIDEVIEE
jgi:heptosyltransferase-1